MNEAVLYLNQIIEAAAKKVGIKYLDIQDSYGNHALCGSAQPTAVNSIKFGDDIGPVNGADWLKFIGQESFHANPIGHNYAANSIIESIDNILSYNNCSGMIVVCPTEVTIPEPSNYWIPENYHNYPSLRLSNFISDSVESVDKKLITLPHQSLKPNSSVVIEINSTPQLLGQFQVSSEGSLYVTVDLPVDFSEGYHTIHIYGTSYSGESVDLYQVIKYIKPIIVSSEQTQKTENKPDTIPTPDISETIVKEAKTDVYITEANNPIEVSKIDEILEINNIEITNPKDNITPLIDDNPPPSDEPPINVPVPNKNVDLDVINDTYTETTDKTLVQTDYLKISKSSDTPSVLGSTFNNEITAKTSIQVGFSDKTDKVGRDFTIYLIFAVISAIIVIVARYIFVSKLRKG